MALTCAVALALCLPLLRPIVRTEDRVTPASALAAAARMGLAGHVFNSEGFGGYLVFHGVPAFIDGRIELYGNAFLARYLDAVNGNGRALGEPPRPLENQLGIAGAAARRRRRPRASAGVAARLLGRARRHFCSHRPATR